MFRALSRSAGFLLGPSPRTLSFPAIQMRVTLWPYSSMSSDHRKSFLFTLLLERSEFVNRLFLWSSRARRGKPLTKSLTEANDSRKA